MSAAPLVVPVRERPILFSGPMVCAILAGTKTQTRRVMNPQPPAWIEQWGYTAFTPPGHISGRGDYEDQGPAEKFFRLKYGHPGDRLWVRETWCPEYEGEGSYLYRADPSSDGAIFPDGGHWRPSIFMPRWASRLTLEIAEVRVQRLQEITEEDAIAEGLTWQDQVHGPRFWHGGPHRVKDKGSKVFYLPVQAYADLWDQINAKRGYTWESNPFVWAITFRRLA